MTIVTDQKYLKSFILVHLTCKIDNDGLYILSLHTYIFINPLSEGH